MGMTLDSAPGRDSCRRSRRRKLLLTAGICLGLLAVPAWKVGGQYVAFSRAAADLPKQRDAARREGIPTASEELGRLTSTGVAAGPNAADLYRSLLTPGKREPKGAGDDGEAIREFSRAPRGPGFPRPDATAARGYFSRIAADMEVAERASRLPRCDWGTAIFEGNVAMEYPAGLARGLVRNFCNRALFKSDDGDIAGAFADIETAGRIGRHFGEAPALVSLLVEYATVALTDATFRRVLLAHHQNPDALRLAHECAETLPEAPDLRRSLLGEVVVFRNSLKTHRGEVQRLAGRSQRLPGVLIDAFEAKGIARWREVLRACEAHEKDPLARYQAVKNLSDAQKAWAKEPGNQLAAVTFPPLEGVARASLEDEARRRMRVALLGLVEARQRGGRWPATLAVSVRNDPFTGTALGYRVTEEGRGFVLYSVGRDFRDDGGATGSAPYGEKRGLDYVISWRPAR